MDLTVVASAEFESVVRLLPADCWGLPTPSEMSVRDLVDLVSGTVTAIRGNWADLTLDPTA